MEKKEGEEECSNQKERGYQQEIKEAKKLCQCGCFVSRGGCEEEQQTTSVNTKVTVTAYGPFPFHPLAGKSNLQKGDIASSVCVSVVLWVWKLRNYCIRNCSIRSDDHDDDSGGGGGGGGWAQSVEKPFSRRSLS